MVDYYCDKDTRAKMNSMPMCRQYMYNYLEIITTISSVLALCSYTKSDMTRKNELWQYIKDKDFFLYRKLRLGIFGIAMNAPGKGGRDITVGGYKVVRRFFNFN